MKPAVYVTEKTITFNSTKKNLKDFLKHIDYIQIGDSKKDIRKVKSNIYNLSIDSDNVPNTSFIYRKSFDKLVEVERSVFDNIRSWARERGIYDKGNTHTQYVKLQEEAGELAKALLKNDMAEIEDAIGDMVVVLTNLSEQLGLRIEDCVESAYNVIKNRKGKMINGTFVKEQ